MEIVVTTFKGLEQILAQEMTSLGAESVTIGNRAVTGYGDKELLYRLNYLLRTGLKVLVPIDRITANNPDELYRNTRKINFSAYLDADSSFAIDITCHSEIFTHSQFALYKIKDAIADQYRQRHGQRPNIDVNEPDFRLHVRITGNEIYFSSDSSGETLNKRKYKTAINAAPLNEVLAAGLVMMSGWSPERSFSDPMAGSGTIGIEAAMIGTHTPAQVHRTRFTLKKWRNYNPSLWADVCNKAKSGIDNNAIKITVSDNDLNSLKAIRENLSLFDFTPSIKIERKDFFTSENAADFVLFNPPYDQRIRLDNALEFYEEIGTHLKHHYENKEVWIFSSFMEGMKKIGLKPFRKFPLNNGPLEAKLKGYKIFGGKMSDLKKQSGSD
jgi:putative N6-adenine-specific DNA methylase